MQRCRGSDKEVLKSFRGVQRSCRGFAQEVQVHLLWAVVQSYRRCRICRRRCRFGYGEVLRC